MSEMVALPTAERSAGAELKRLAAALGGANVDATAWDAASHIDPRSIAAVADAIASCHIVPTVRRLAGYASREDPCWVRLLLLVESAGDPGSPAWDADLEQSGAIVALAMAQHPELTDLASEISFDF